MPTGDLNPTPFASSVQAAPLLVTISQAAKILAVGRSTIYQLMWNGDLTPIHIGRCVRLTTEQLREFVDSRTE